jgi:hypothetical protein
VLANYSRNRGNYFFGSKRSFLVKAGEIFMRCGMEIWKGLVEFGFISTKLILMRRYLLECIDHKRQIICQQINLAPATILPTMIPTFYRMPSNSLIEHLYIFEHNLFFAMLLSNEFQKQHICYESLSIRPPQSRYKKRKISESLGTPHEVPN